MEIKSLLLGKFIEMQGKKIDYVFECMNPIQTISMHSNDFIRAIGILIDNAIEAVEGHPTGYINVLLYQEDTYLKVVVENTIHEPIEINRIFSPDYSSKGSGRGLGLQSYRSILNKYRNAVGHTSCTNHKFKQELRVEG
ncbi:GHKL domain-containing protein [Erysipelothrix sp. Poltava]|nr:GHKL domain-containing protein [Erysipelothrix sp. Poltava]